MAAYCEGLISNLGDRILQPLYALKEIKSEDEFSQFLPKLNNHFRESSKFIDTIFEELEKHERQGLDLEEDFQLLWDIVDGTEDEWRNSSPHPWITHPEVTHLHQAIYEYLVKNLVPYLHRNLDPQTGVPKTGAASRSFAFFQLSAVQMLKGIWFSKYRRGGMVIGDIRDEEYAEIKGWFQDYMSCCLLAADRAIENNFRSLNIELRISYCEIPTYVGLGSHRTEDLSDISPEHDISFLIQTLEQCNYMLFVADRWSDREEAVRRELLHRCRVVRGFFQLHLELFQDETDWMSAMFKADHRRALEGDNIDRYFLADLGRNETIGGWGDPF